MRTAGAKPKMIVATMPAGTPRPKKKIAGIR